MKPAIVTPFAKLQLAAAKRSEANAKSVPKDSLLCFMMLHFLQVYSRKRCVRQLCSDFTIHNTQLYEPKSKENQARDSKKETKLTAKSTGSKKTQNLKPKPKADSKAPKETKGRGKRESKDSSDKPTGTPYGEAKKKFFAKRSPYLTNWVLSRPAFLFMYSI